MPGDDAFEVEGAVMEVAANGTFLVKLANSHCFTGYIPARRKAAVGELEPGNRVMARLSAYDLSTGRILNRINDNNL